MDPQPRQQSQTSSAPPSYPTTNYTTPTTVNATPPPQSGRNKLLLKIGIVILTILIVGTAATVMYAYKVFLAGDKSFQESVADFVQGIPFMPKTPRYVLKASVKAHQKVTRFTIDASVAISSTGLSSLTGMNNFDIQILGPLDYTDPNNPILSLNVSSKEFSLDVKRKDYIVYFHINEFPAFLSLLLTNFGIDETLQKQFTNKWFFLDTKPLETDARRSLDTQNTNSSMTNKAIKDVFDSLDDPKVMKALTMNSNILSTIPVYHIHFAPTDEVLDKFYEKYLRLQYPSSRQYNSEDYKISKTITRFVMESWIDKKDYYVSKISVVFTVKAQPSSYNRPSPFPNVLPNQTSDISVSFVVNLSDFGKKIPFVIPENSVKFDEFLKSVMPQAPKAVPEVAD